MTPTQRRYTVVLSVLIEEEDANGRTVSIGYAPTGGNDGLEQAIARQLSVRGWTEGAAPDLPFGDAARRWDARLPEEFGETILSEPDPVAWSEHDSLLDALLEIQALFELGGDRGAGETPRRRRHPPSRASSSWRPKSPTPKKPRNGSTQSYSARSRSDAVKPPGNERLIVRKCFGK
jgi:hypothetical protein